MDAEAPAHAEAEQGTPPSDDTEADSPIPEASSDGAQNGHHAATEAVGIGEEQEQAPPAEGDAEGDAAPAMEGRPSAQLDLEVAKMLSGMSGGAGGVAGCMRAGLGGAISAWKPAQALGHPPPPTPAGHPPLPPHPPRPAPFRRRGRRCRRRSGWLREGAQPGHCGQPGGPAGAA